MIVIFFFFRCKITTFLPISQIIISKNALLSLSAYLLKAYGRWKIGDKQCVVFKTGHP